VGTVIGVVVDDTKQVVAGARVEIVELGLSTRADQQGKFVFLGVPVQPLTIRASADGHHPSNPTIFKASGDVELTIDIELGARPRIICCKLIPEFRPIPSFMI